MTNSPLKVWMDRDGRLLRLRLANPKANLVDAAMVSELSLALTEQLSNPDLQHA
jgi:cyclohexa-1,5-dienecarbonyl-CoA hydratase